MPIEFALQSEVLGHLTAPWIVRVLMYRFQNSLPPIGEAGLVATVQRKFEKYSWQKPSPQMVFDGLQFLRDRGLVKQALPLELTDAGKEMGVMLMPVPA